MRPNSVKFASKDSDSVVLPGQQEIKKLRV